MARKALLDDITFVLIPEHLEEASHKKIAKRGRRFQAEIVNIRTLKKD